MPCNWHGYCGPGISPPSTSRSWRMKRSETWCGRAKMHFKMPRQLMSYLGLIPSEHTSGERRRQGGITKTGNSHARRVLIEGAWAYRYPAKVSRHLQLRLEHVPKVIQDISWKAQVRLCKRYRRLVARGKNVNQVVVAIAREMAAFVWAIAREVAVAH